MSFAISISVRFKIRRCQIQDRIIENEIFPVPKANSISDFETKVNFFNSIAIKKNISFLNFRLII
ncbi:unnamed protein product [Brassica oleracea]|uniref:(rape) hypothetical protein n=1 Tax=Brassica napus TaxID=3708 RepID=A0A816JP80_BRANA|nr:unnamed protein product [Brassica napus]